MANQQWNLSQARPWTGRDGQENTKWTSLGRAILDSKGRLQMFFDALPLTDAEGKVVVWGFEPKPDEGRPARGTSNPPAEAAAKAPAPRRGGRPPADDDDEIPFGPEMR